jgi:signal transduction histidine kinase
VTSGVAFQTRARTIDHLGRGQIADSPTAISELWKNSYDAYATNVSLHIFDGEVQVASIFDDGVGMNRRDIVERWLVIGTESKLLSETDPINQETFGLEIRQRQGEKGIGRLSAAFLAPATLLVSKRLDGRFVAIMVDWRLFENPFITLDDVRLPIEEFDKPDEIFDRLGAMSDLLRANLGGHTDERSVRLKENWTRYSEYEHEQGKNNDTAGTIAEFWQNDLLGRRHLEEWPVQLGLADHGTAIFLLGIHHELAVWVRPESDEESDLVKARLRETLTGFTDPYAYDRKTFAYEVLIHQGHSNQTVLTDRDVFGRQDLHGLEHYIEGAFDEEGVFRGRVVVFGQDFGEKEFVPKRRPPGDGRDRLGPFDFCIGTFEQDPAKTTLSDEQYARYRDLADKFGGIAVYRDGLRVMPYGRPDSDFFEVEERRTKHAGRYFWSHRRSFGRVGIAREANPNLRDKAGREGLVENRANRELRILVKGILIDFAYRFFGTDSDLRKEMLPGITARNKAAKEAAEKARTRRRKNVRVFLREQRSPLIQAVARSRQLIAEGETIRDSKDRERATMMFAEVLALGASKEALRPPPVPAKLGDLEDKYREYRDDYREFIAGLDELAKLSAEIQVGTGSLAPAEMARQTFRRNQSLLSARVDEYAKSADQKLETLIRTWKEKASNDRAIYYKDCSPLLANEPSVAALPGILNVLDARRIELEAAIADSYEPFIRSLEQLLEGIDLDSALAVTDDERVNLEQKVKDLHAVAQVGITVEIVGHELESLDTEVRRNLQRLPAEIKKTSAYKLAYEAQSALTERLRFLSPLKVAGYRSKQDITGAEIADYMSDFFRKDFEDNRITFQASDAFRSIKISDLPSRIFPVFINLINNSIYWLGQATDRQIELDYIDSKVIVADSGRGVDADDVPRLFDLFFSRRRAGRGVGLYLCKANLAVGGNLIRYAEDGDPKALPGANFIIEFKGLGDSED